MKQQNIIVPYIENVKLNHFMLAAPSDKSDNAAVKLDAFNYYHSSQITSLPDRIACFLLQASLPTKQITCSHIFQKRWFKDRMFIDLSEINDPQNVLFLFKPIEVAFDEGRIIFLWNTFNFELKVLDPSLSNMTVLDLGKYFFLNVNSDSPVSKRLFH